MKKGQIACLISSQANHVLLSQFDALVYTTDIYILFLQKKKSTPVINGFGQIHQYPMIFASFNWMKSVQCCFVFDGCIAVKIMVAWFYMSEKSQPVF